MAEYWQNQDSCPEEGCDRLVRTSVDTARRHETKDWPTYEELADCLADLIDRAPHAYHGSVVVEGGWTNADGEWVGGRRVGVCTQCGRAWPCPQSRAVMLIGRLNA